MTGNKIFEIRDLRKGTEISQPVYIDVLIGNVMVKGIEVYFDDNENPCIKFPVHEVTTRYGKSEIEIVSISNELRENIVSELMDNYEEQIYPNLNNGLKPPGNNGYHEFLPRENS